MTLKFHKILRMTIVVSFILASLQILVVLVLGGYDFSIGKFHFSSHRTGNIFFIQIILAFVLRMFFSPKKGPREKRPEIRAPFFRGREKRFLLAALIAIVAFSSLAYYRVLPGFFLSDDFEYLQLFDRAKSLNSDILFGYLKGFGLLRPLSILSLYGDFRIWHLNPFGYHLTNLVLHILNASLLLFILLILSNDRTFSLGGAVLFSLYPTHPEAVSWISGRFDVLCATFYLFAVLFFLLSSARPRRSHPFLILSLVAFLSALLSKEMALSLPLILILIETTFRIESGSRSLKDRFMRHVPFWLLGLVYLAVRLVLFKGVGGYVPSHGRAFFSSWSLLDIRDIFLRPFSSLFLPLNSSLYPQAVVIKSILLIVISIAILFLPFRKKLNFPLLLFGFCFIPLAVLPAFRIFYVSPALEGTRFLYLPSMGACVIIAAFLKNRDDPAPWKKIWMCFPVVLFFLFLMKNNTAWNSASKMSERMAHQALILLNNVDFRETIYVLGLPDNYGGAYIFRNGFASAINLLRDENPLNIIEIRQKTPDESKPDPGDLVLEWKTDQFLLYRASSFHSPERKK